MSKYKWVLVLGVLSAFAFQAIGFAAQTRPNVIFILMDDMGYSDVSCYGAEKVNTPNIDRMAAEGIKFTDFHTAASICSPSRAAFLTSAYPQRAGLYMGINPNREAHWFLGLNSHEITIVEQFKKQGYTTAMIGKWHLGMQEEFLYHHQGFDHYYGAPENMGQRGSEQRPTGMLFPEVPIVTNHLTDWDKLSDEEKGRAKTEFDGGPRAKKMKR